MENNVGVNLLMVEYEENVNVVAKINTELCKMYGLEHYLTEFSSNLINALNQYKRFVLLMNERKKFVEGLLDFSNACIEFFEENKDVNKSSHDAIVEKMNNLIKTMNVINDQINNNFQDSVKDYLK